VLSIRFEVARCMPSPGGCRKLRGAKSIPLEVWEHATPTPQKAESSKMPLSALWQKVVFLFFHSEFYIRGSFMLLWSY